MSFSDKLKEARQRTGMAQEQIAVKISMPCGIVKLRHNSALNRMKGYLNQVD